eukprot:2114806-Prymnesium_polylepis.1
MTDRVHVQPHDECEADAMIIRRDTAVPDRPALVSARRYSRKDSLTAGNAKPRASPVTQTPMPCRFPRQTWPLLMSPGCGSTQPVSSALAHTRARRCRKGPQHLTEPGRCAHLLPSQHPHDLGQHTLRVASMMPAEQKPSTRGRRRKGNEHRLPSSLSPPCQSFLFTASFRARVPCAHRPHPS